jgi:glycosyltransferase involved in cell wall biosynthesis
MTVKVFLYHQIRALSKVYNVTLVVNLQDQKDLYNYLPKSVEVLDVPIHREISIYYDLKALVILTYVFYKAEFSLVHSFSPKAGLLTMLASWMIGSPKRLHTFTGQVWLTKNGLMKILLRLSDRLIDALATNVLIDSPSQKKFLLDNHVVKSDNSIVLGKGSISGVDLDRFKPNLTMREEIRCKFGLTNTVVLILFVGRLKRDKGVLDLIKAFSNVRRNLDNTALLIVGPDEDGLESEIKCKEGVYLAPFTEFPEHYMAASDVFCLPSYREGFGSVVIEAAACGVPSIGSNIYGLRDAIIDGETGILVHPKSVREIEKAIYKLVKGNKLRYKMGKAARTYVKENFSNDSVTKQLLALYKDLLQ